MNDDINAASVVEELLKRILPNVFHAEKPKQQYFFNYDKTSISCACPICGDSDQHVYKKRFHIYIDTMHAKCYNCGYYAGVQKFIRDVTEATPSISIPTELYTDINTLCKQSKDNRRNDNTDLRLSSDKTKQVLSISKATVSSSFLNINELSKINNWIPISSSKEAASYLLSRYCTAFCLSNRRILPHLRWDSKTSRIVIPDGLLQDDTLYVSGAQMRYIGNDATKVRYLTIPPEKLLKPGISSDIIKKGTLRHVISTGNLMNIDISKPVICTEGFFDAGFLNNSIYLKGVHNESTLSFAKQLLPQLIYMPDNDTSGMGATINASNIGCDVVDWNDVMNAMTECMPEGCKIKDINDIMKAVASKGGNLGEARDTLNAAIHSDSSLYSDPLIIAAKMLAI